MEGYYLRVFDQRRPELYKELMTNTFAWNSGDFFGLYGHRPLPRGGRATVAVAEFEPTGDSDRNLALIETLARQAQAQGAELVVFPERALTGLECPAETAVAADGEAVARLARLVASLRLHLVAGFAERDGTTLYNSAIVAGPNGPVGTYRQTHPALCDPQWATHGRSSTCLSTAEQFQASAAV